MSKDVDVRRTFKHADAYNKGWRYVVWVGGCDDYCFAEYGHTDWAILDELSWQERLQKKYEVKNFSFKEVAFFVKEDE